MTLSLAKQLEQVVKDKSSRDLACSASRSVENLEREVANLKALLGELQILDSKNEERALIAEPERSAFKFLGDQATGHQRPNLPDPVLLENIARNRRRRADFFGKGLFADPAWDMIVDLAIARSRFVRVSVSSLCIASGVPPTTALRWIGLLVDRGVFQREDDATDRRRALVSLTDGGMRKVANYFSEVELSPFAII